MAVVTAVRYKVYLPSVAVLSPELSGLSQVTFILAAFKVDKNVGQEIPF